MADRMRALLDAGIAISSQLSLDSLLQKLTETAAELTEARYAALGVIDPSGRELERFLTHGIDPETHTAIGDLPRGRGILGVLGRTAAPAPRFSSRRLAHCWASLLCQRRDCRVTPWARNPRSYSSAQTGPASSASLNSRNQCRPTSAATPPALSASFRRR